MIREKHCNCCLKIKEIENKIGRIQEDIKKMQSNKRQHLISTNVDLILDIPK